MNDEELQFGREPEYPREANVCVQVCSTWLQVDKQAGKSSDKPA